MLIGLVMGEQETMAGATLIEAAQAYQSPSKVGWAGIIIVYMSILAFSAVGASLYVFRHYRRTEILSYTPEFILCGIGVFTALLGVKLVRAGGTTPSDPLPVVNKKEWEILSTAIQTSRDDPIGQYIRLSSLTGVTGLFTKLGLSGLPLATIALTIFFALMSVGLQTVEAQAKFYELTQLTLGAFIGSFVQRQVAALGEAASASDRTKSAEKKDPDRPEPLAAGGEATGASGNTAG